MMNLTKSMSLMFLCAMYTSSYVFAMEMDGNERSLSSSTPPNTSQMFIPYNVDNVSEVSDHGDMFDYLYNIDWRCPICLEDDQSGITALRCGHKVHKDCMTFYLIHGTSAARLCPVCMQAHRLRRNIATMIRQRFQFLLKADPSSIEGVCATFVEQYKKLIVAGMEAFEKAIDHLSECRLQRFYQFLRDQDSGELGQQFRKNAQRSIVVGMNLCQREEQGETITKDKVRQALSFELGFFRSLIQEKIDLSTKHFLVSLLNEQGEDGCAANLSSVVENQAQFETENIDSVSTLSFEVTVDVGFRQFSPSHEELFIEVQNMLDSAKAAADEIGIPQEERERHYAEIVQGAIEQFRQQNNNYEEGQQEQQEEEAAPENAAPEQGRGW